MQKRALLLLLAGLASCQRDLISVRREFLSCQSLASYIVETPDPNLSCPPTGESLVVSWNLQVRATLTATLRLMNGEERVEQRRLSRPKGTTSFDLINDDYFRTGGYRTYKLAVIDDDGQEIATFSHHLFTEIIRF